jgi:murein DD-endopeptidase MepM/ murein hydrolase activator NlpD
MRPIVLGLLLLLAAPFALLWWLKFDHGSPTVQIAPDSNVVGREASWDVTVRASGKPGLRNVKVTLTGNGQTIELANEDIPADGWLGSGVGERRVHVATDLASRGVGEGDWQLAVAADTYAWHVIPSRDHALLERTVHVDLVPPELELLTTQHNIRLGGASLAVFRVGDDAVSAGMAVGDYFFPAERGYFADPRVAFCLFAVPENLSDTVVPTVRVADAVGNARTAALPCTIHPRTFRERSLEIDDAFLQRKIPELFAALHLAVPADLVKGYLQVNGDVRRESEKKLKEITAKSAPTALWDGAFHRQSNSAPMSSFADRRTYVYHGEPIDHQTHLGFDLASLKRAPVEATANGVVLFADMLGIYGNTVVLDHGLGVASLYGHLSTFAVKPGDRVQSGQSVGQTGETGLAGGDHLHFSIMVHGTHVDPVEWWDGKWIKDHVTGPLAMFPANGHGTESVGGEAPKPNAAEG